MHRGRKRLGRLKAAQVEKEFKWARSVIIVAAALFALSGVLQWLAQRGMHDLYRRDPRIPVDERTLAEADANFVAFIVLGAVYSVLFLLSKKRPFGATLTALIVYVALLAPSWVLRPPMISIGLVLELTILFVLASGVLSARAYRKMSRYTDHAG